MSWSGSTHKMLQSIVLLIIFNDVMSKYSHDQHSSDMSHNTY